MRSCLIGTALARELGAAEPEVADTFYACLLVHIGCTAFSHETAAVFGDELQNTRAVARTNFADPTEVLTSFVPEATRGMSARSRVRVATFIVVKGNAFGRRYETASCEVARATARRIALPDGVQRSVYEVHEWWNGKGARRGLRGEQIALPARLARVATEAARFCDIGGVEVTIDALRRRSGRDPRPGDRGRVRRELPGDPSRGELRGPTRVYPRSGAGAGHRVATSRASAAGRSVRRSRRPEDPVYTRPLERGGEAGNGRRRAAEARRCDDLAAAAGGAPSRPSQCASCERLA
jgi:HD domain